jgi:hypothetical protein
LTKIFLLSFAKSIWRKFFCFRLQKKSPSDIWKTHKTFKWQCEKGQTTIQKDILQQKCLSRKIIFGLFFQIHMHIPTYLHIVKVSWVKCMYVEKMWSKGLGKLGHSAGP